jgi:multisubunit Na+/H+ antiporter MnhC subunit
MRTRGSEVPLAAAARNVADRAREFVRLELELAATELKRKLVAVGLGIGLLVGAVVLLLFGLGFALAGGAAGLETALPTWASLLIVAGALLLTAATLAALGVAALRRGTPPVPQQAIEEAKLTTEALRSDGNA